jgi:GT2 family glycosyltransferase
MTDLLSIVIVNWNGCALLQRCLAALVPQLVVGDQVIVVDNGSHDDSVTWLKTTHPNITCIALPTNIGFSGGNNAALPACTNPWIFLLNNDAFVEPGALAALRAASVCEDRVGAISATMVFDHAPDLIASNGIVLRRDGVALDHGMTDPVRDLPAQPFAVTGASGGAVLLRRTMIDDIGLFPDDFFNYLEDVDLAWRAILRGWQTLSCPTAHIRHVYSATSGQGSPFKQRLLGRNRWRTLIRCLPPALWWRLWHHILAYELAACAGLAWNGAWSGIAGRFSNIRDIPVLLSQRHEIQRRRTVSDRAIEAFLVPAPWPWHELQNIRRLAAVLAARRTQ